MILVTNAQYGDIVFEGDNDKASVQSYCELKDLPGISHQREDGIWVLTNGVELDVIYSEDYFVVH